MYADLSHYNQNRGWKRSRLRAGRGRVSKLAKGVLYNQDSFHLFTRILPASSAWNHLISSFRRSTNFIYIHTMRFRQFSQHVIQSISLSVRGFEDSVQRNTVIFSVLLFLQYATSILATAHYTFNYYFPRRGNANKIHYRGRIIIQDGKWEEFFIHRDRNK